MSHPSKDYKEPTAQSLAPIELRLLAGLEVKRRQLQRELAEVMEQYQELTREIESKRIPVQWLRY